MNWVTRLLGPTALAKLILNYTNEFGLKIKFNLGGMYWYWCTLNIIFLNALHSMTASY